MDKSQTQFYHDRLVEEKRRLETEVAACNRSIVQTLAPPGELSKVPTHLADRDAAGVEPQIRVEGVLRGKMHAIDEALQRIEEGRFGICVGCRNPIASERLEVIPYAAYCAHCATDEHRH